MYKYVYIYIYTHTVFQFINLCIYFLLYLSIYTNIHIYMCVCAFYVLPSFSWFERPKASALQASLLTPVNQITKALCSCLTHATCTLDIVHTHCATPDNKVNTSIQVQVHASTSRLPLQLPAAQSEFAFCSISTKQRMRLAFNAFNPNQLRAVTEKPNHGLSTNIRPDTAALTSLHAAEDRSKQAQSGLSRPGNSTSMYMHLHLYNLT
jgi:hypothetical protein